MNVNSSDERELGTTTLMIDLRFRGRKWKDYFFLGEKQEVCQEMEAEASI